MHSTVFGPLDQTTWTTASATPTFDFAINRVENGFILYYNNTTYVFSSLNKIFTFLKKDQSENHMDQA